MHLCRDACVHWLAALPGPDTSSWGFRPRDVKTLKEKSCLWEVNLELFRENVQDRPESPRYVMICPFHGSRAEFCFSIPETAHRSPVKEQTMRYLQILCLMSLGLKLFLLFIVQLQNKVKAFAFLMKLQTCYPVITSCPRKIMNPWQCLLPPPVVLQWCSQRPAESVGDSAITSPTDWAWNASSGGQNQSHSWRVIF